MKPVTTTDFFRSLANEKRQQIVFEVLSDKEGHTVGEIADRLRVAHSTASEHLAILKRSGVAVAEKREREVYYRLDVAGIRKVLTHLNDWLDCC